MKTFICAILTLVLVTVTYIAEARPMHRILLSGKKIVPFVSSGTVRWYRADMGGVLHGDSIGGTGREWIDVSATGDHAVQAIGSKQPIYYLSSLGGKPSLQFDGALSDIGFTTVSLSHNSWTLVFVVKSTGAGSRGILTDSATVGSNFLYLGTDGSSPSGYSASAVSSALWTLPNINNSAKIVQIRGDLVFKLNNLTVSPSVIDNSNTATTFDTIGWETDGDTRFQGNIAEVIIYNRNLTDRELNQNYEAFRSRYQ